MAEYDINVRVETTYVFAQRAADKAEARRKDDEGLRSERVTPSEMARRNGFFSILDLSKSRIVAIGARSVRKMRENERLTKEVNDAAEKAVSGRTPRFGWRS